jgi:hypothetical protein
LQALKTPRSRWIKTATPANNTNDDDNADDDDDQLLQAKLGKQLTRQKAFVKVMKTQTT